MSSDETEPFEFNSTFSSWHNKHALEISLQDLSGTRLKAVL